MSCGFNSHFNLIFAVTLWTHWCKCCTKYQKCQICSAKTSSVRKERNLSALRCETGFLHLWCLELVSVRLTVDNSALKYICGKQVGNQYYSHLPMGSSFHFCKLFRTLFIWDTPGSRLSSQKAISSIINRFIKEHIGGKVNSWPLVSNWISISSKSVNTGNTTNVTVILQSVTGIFMVAKLHVS